MRGATALRAKLGAQVALAVGATLVIAGATFVIYDAYTFEEFLQNELDSQVQVMASQVSASMSFGDIDGTVEVLRALSSADRLEAAAVCSRTGELIGGHRPDGRPISARVCRTSEEGLWARALVVTDQETIGTVVLRGSTSAATSRTKRFSLVVVALMAPAMLLALLLAARVRAAGDVFVALEAALDDAKGATRAKSEFLANMSHEIRTPLNGMIGSMELMLESQLAADQRTLVSTTHDCAKALSAVVHDILDVSRIDAGALVLERRVVPLRAVLEDVLALFAIDAKRKQLELSIELDDAVPASILTDGQRLRQILTNLTANAVKFTSSGGVTIRTTMAQERISIAVIDTGIGIPKDRRESIFGEFQQADGSTTRRFGGAGLGLAIVKGVVERMDGSISVEDGDAGIGSAFVVQLPCEAATDAPAAPHPSAEEQPTRRRLLLCEDNAVNRMVATRMLKRLGCDVTHASDGVEAVQRWAEDDFDLIFMDCQMPNLDGYDATAEIRRRTAEDGREHVPILALTANVLPDDIERCREVGMDGVVAKPVSLRTLKETLADEATSGSFRVAF